MVSMFPDRFKYATRESARSFCIYYWGEVDGSKTA